MDPNLLHNHLEDLLAGNEEYHPNSISHFALSEFWSQYVHPSPHIKTAAFITKLIACISAAIVTPLEKAGTSPALTASPRSLKTIQMTPSTPRSSNPPSTPKYISGSKLRDIVLNGKHVTQIFANGQSTRSFEVDLQAALDVDNQPELTARKLEIVSRFIPPSTTLLEAVYCIAYLGAKVILPPLVHWHCSNEFLTAVHHHMTHVIAKLLSAVRCTPSAPDGSIASLQGFKLESKTYFHPFCYDDCLNVAEPAEDVLFEMFSSSGWHVVGGKGRVGKTARVVGAVRRYLHRQRTQSFGNGKFSSKGGGGLDEANDKSFDIREALAQADALLDASAAIDGRVLTSSSSISMQFIDCLYADLRNCNTAVEVMGSLAHQWHLPGGNLQQLEIRFRKWLEKLRPGSIVLLDHITAARTASILLHLFDFVSAKISIMLITAGAQFGGCLQVRRADEMPVLDDDPVLAKIVEGLGGPARINIPKNVVVLGPIMAVDQLAAMFVSEANMRKFGVIPEDMHIRKHFTKLTFDSPLSSSDAESDSRQDSVNQLVCLLSQGDALMMELLANASPSQLKQLRNNHIMMNPSTAQQEIMLPLSPNNYFMSSEICATASTDAMPSEAGVGHAFCLIACMAPLYSLQGSSFHRSLAWDLSKDTFVKLLEGSAVPEIRAQEEDIPHDYDDSTPALQQRAYRAFLCAWTQLLHTGWLKHSTTLPASLEGVGIEVLQDDKTVANFARENIENSFPLPRSPDGREGAPTSPRRLLTSMGSKAFLHMQSFRVSPKADIGDELLSLEMMQQEHRHHEAHDVDDNVSDNDVDGTPGGNGKASSPPGKRMLRKYSTSASLAWATRSIVDMSRSINANSSSVHSFRRNHKFGQDPDEYVTLGAGVTAADKVLDLALHAVLTMTESGDGDDDELTSQFLQIQWDQYYLHWCQRFTDISDELRFRGCSLFPNSISVESDGNAATADRQFGDLPYRELIDLIDEDIIHYQRLFSLWMIPSNLKADGTKFWLYKTDNSVVLDTVRVEGLEDSHDLGIRRDDASKFQDSLVSVPNDDECSSDDENISPVIPLKTDDKMEFDFDRSLLSPLSDQINEVDGKSSVSVESDAVSRTQNVKMEDVSSSRRRQELQIYLHGFPAAISAGSEAMGSESSRLEPSSPLSKPRGKSPRKLELSRKSSVSVNINTAADFDMDLDANVPEMPPLPPPSSEERFDVAEAAQNVQEVKQHRTIKIAPPSSLEDLTSQFEGSIAPALSLRFPLFRIHEILTTFKEMTPTVDSSRLTRAIIASSLGDVQLMMESHGQLAKTTETLLRSAVKDFCKLTNSDVQLLWLTTTTSPRNVQGIDDSIAKMVMVCTAMFALGRVHLATGKILEAKLMLRALLLQIRKRISVQVLAASSVQKILAVYGKELICLLADAMAVLATLQANEHRWQKRTGRTYVMSDNKGKGEPGDRKSDSSQLFGTEENWEMLNDEEDELENGDVECDSDVGSSIESNPDEGSVEAKDRTRFPKQASPSKSFLSLSSKSLSRHNSLHSSLAALAPSSHSHALTFASASMVESLAVTKRVLQLCDRAFDQLHKEIDTFSHYKHKRKHGDTYAELLEDNDIQATLARADNDGSSSCPRTNANSDLTMLVGNFIEALKVYYVLFGENSLRVADLSFELGQFYFSVGKYDDSKLLFETALSIYKVRFDGSANARSGYVLVSLAESIIALDSKKIIIYKRLLEEALKIFEQVYTNQHVALTTVRDRLKKLYSHRSVILLAESALADKCNRLQDIITSGSAIARKAALPEVCRMLVMKGWMYLKSGRFLRAVMNFRLAAENIAVCFGPPPQFSSHLCKCLLLLAYSLVGYAHIPIQGSLEIWGNLEPFDDYFEGKNVRSNDEVDDDWRALLKKAESCILSHANMRRECNMMCMGQTEVLNQVLLPAKVNALEMAARVNDKAISLLQSGTENVKVVTSLQLLHAKILCLCGQARNAAHKIRDVLETVSHSASESLEGKCYSRQEMKIQLHLMLAKAQFWDQDYRAAILSLEESEKLLSSLQNDRAESFKHGAAGDIYFAKGHCYCALDDNLEALTQFKLALSIFRTADASKAAADQLAAHKKTAEIFRAMAAAYIRLHNVGEAKRALKNAHGLFRDAYGEEHCDVAQVIMQMGLLLESTESLAEAERFCSHALKVYCRLYGPRHALCLAAAEANIRLLRNLDRGAEAAVLQESLKETTTTIMRSSATNSTESRPALKSSFRSQNTTVAASSSKRMNPSNKLSLESELSAIELDYALIAQRYAKKYPEHTSDDADEVSSGFNRAIFGSAEAQLQQSDSYGEKKTNYSKGSTRVQNNNPSGCGCVIC